MLYAILLYLHIFSVIASLGPFFVMFPAVSKMRSADGEQLAALIDLFRFTIRLTKHAGHVLVVTGVGLVFVLDMAWTTSWLIATIAVMFSSLFFIARAFSPALRKAAEPGENRAEALRSLYRSLWIYFAIMLLMMWFMVAKPTLW